jgi:hypothetical protein
MLTAAEAGKILGLSARTMYDLAKAGKIRKLPGGFNPADVEAYKASCCVPVFVGPPRPVAPAPNPWDDPDSALARYFWRRRP